MIELLLNGLIKNCYNCSKLHCHNFFLCLNVSFVRKDWKGKTTLSCSPIFEVGFYQSPQLQLAFLLLGILKVMKIRSCLELERLVVAEKVRGCAGFHFSFKTFHWIVGSFSVQVCYDFSDIPMALRLGEASKRKYNFDTPGSFLESKAFGFFGEVWFQSWNLKE